MSEPSYESTVPEEVQLHIDSFLSPDSKRATSATGHTGEAIHGGVRLVRTPEQLTEALADPGVRLVNLRPRSGVRLVVNTPPAASA